MKLHSLPRSPNTRKVLATLQHIGVDVDVAMLEFARGDLRTPAFIGLNPNAMVPVLEDGDVVLWESNAIMVYLAEKFGATDLLPASRQGRADVLRWLFWEGAHYNRALAVLIFEGIIKPLFGHPDAAPEVLAFHRGELARFAAVFDGHLAGRDTVVGDGVTLADYALVCLERYRGEVGFDWSPYPNVNRFYEQTRALPAWKKAAETAEAAVLAQVA